MFIKNAQTLRHSLPTWFYLLSVSVAAFVLLSACGGGPTSSTGGTTSSPTVASTPTVAQPTPTPTVDPSQLTPAPGSRQAVLIVNTSDGSYGFSPGTLTIAVGTTVTWKNMSSAPHTVSTDDGQTADSGTIPVGGTFSFTFKTAGTFPYHCNYHPYMRSVIIVK